MCSILTAYFKFWFVIIFRSYQSIVITFWLLYDLVIFKFSNMQILVDSLSFPVIELPVREYRQIPGK